jgi:hypothetical protein
LGKTGKPCPSLDHAYTNNLDGTINDFYCQLFMHQINFAFNPDTSREAQERGRY